MAYVAVPKDLTQVKSKFLFNLTRRQVICFGCGALTGVPLFFILKNYIPITAATLIMILIMMPFFLFAMYEKNGQPLEKILRHFIQSRFIRPKERPYKTQNFYAVIAKQAAIDKEVRSIVSVAQIPSDKKLKKKRAGPERKESQTDPPGTTADRGNQGESPAERETAQLGAGNDSLSENLA